MHPIAGARLLSDILLLPEKLANLGGNNCDTDLISSPISNYVCESTGALENTAGPADPVSGANLHPEHRYFVLPPNDNGAGHEVDFTRAASQGSVPDSVGPATAMPVSASQALEEPSGGSLSPSVPVSPIASLHVTRSLVLRDWLVLRRPRRNPPWISCLC